MKKVNDTQVVELQKQVDEWKSKYVRALADYQNLEKRTRNEVDEARKFAAEVIIGRLLSALDTLARAKVHLKDAGLDLAYKDLVTVLEEQAVEKIDTIGKQFDPHEMECIEVVDLPAGEAGGNDNEVVEEVLPGYRFRGKIIRVAKVKVGKEISKSTNDKSANEKIS